MPYDFIPSRTDAERSSCNKLRFDRVMVQPPDTIRTKDRLRVKRFMFCSVLNYQAMFYRRVRIFSGDIFGVVLDFSHYEHTVRDHFLCSGPCAVTQNISYLLRLHTEQS